jgi:hypothetical protein
MKIKTLWFKWKKLSTKIAVFQSKILLTVLYFILLTPVAIISKLTSDPLKLRYTEASSWWEDKEKEELSGETLKRQF